MKFVKLNLFKAKYPFWWEYDESTPISCATLKTEAGREYKGVNLENENIVTASSWQELDWNGTAILNEDFDTGWLSPSGKFYGCAYTLHSSQAMLVHGKREEDVEREGYIKITRFSSVGKLEVLFFGEITLEQFKWFKTNYFERDREEVLENLEFVLKSYKAENQEQNVF